MSRPNPCPHEQVSCLNQHELIRKYRCDACGEVMMCACDENFGRRFLSHQLAQGTELGTQSRVAVTGGFQPGICNPCRGKPPTPAPGAAIHGRTSKIKRFYWRELFFLETERFADWQADHPDATPEAAADARHQIERDVLAEIKALHARAPLYDTKETSQAEILERAQVPILSLHPEYAATPEKGAVVMLEGEIVSPEAFVADHLARSGWSSMALESVPLHALFGVMMWLLIQDPADPKNRIVGFGSRTAYEARLPNVQIHTHLPEDFGTPGYGRRRKEAIEEHVAFFFHPDGAADRDHLLWLFDYWRAPSDPLRQYLWAHRDPDVDRARRLIEILPPDTVIAILRYLADDYWGRYLGWPDLLAARDGAYQFVEVKSSSDGLSGDQMRWIIDNHEILGLPFQLAKLHRPSRQVRQTERDDDAADD
ncbi:VRR-NUC domain-containing protein [Sphingomonas oryzagri]